MRGGATFRLVLYCQIPAQYPSTISVSIAKMDESLSTKIRKV